MGRKKRGDALEEKKEGPTSLFILRESNVLRRVTKGGIYIRRLLRYFAPSPTCLSVPNLPSFFGPLFFGHPLSQCRRHMYMPPLVPDRVATLRVHRAPHHHRQLRRPRHREAPPQRRQDRASQAARE